MTLLKDLEEIKVKQKLAIFDLDGTLFDTSLVNYYSYKEALEMYNIKMTANFEEYVQNWNGKSYKDFLPDIIVDNFELVEEVHNTKIKLYEKNLDKAKVNNNLFSIIEKIKDDYYISLVTTASKCNTEQIIKYFNKEKLFDYIITKEDVINTKPDSEGFEKVMKKFNIKSENTTIFEDSDVGIIAARKTGANVFIVDRF